ncbi:Cytochrome c oxidase assembly factor 6 homolog [Geodia barretti]|uniref:Cytochrome c oxidase assembly factor 6 homolog n=1 Tax=Geodia barretti TaxID=519541 RepID=A0AA35THP1_GEOBA|nr:Cytochrome c oxidase assembly factor 6 homolog [Geodia barretti]CAI8048208.1 Cytochrome c oxidase assembly factor 6 homolog [Geodia barretti]
MDSAAAEAPNASQRGDCYVARDAFYSCMLKNSEKVEACKREGKEFHSKCLPSWVKHFDKRRVYENYKKKLEEAGYQPLSGNFEKTE